MADTDQIFQYILNETFISIQTLLKFFPKVHLTIH